MFQDDTFYIFSPIFFQLDWGLNMMSLNPWKGITVLIEFDHGVLFWKGRPTLLYLKSAFAPSEKTVSLFGLDLDLVT